MDEFLTACGATGPLRLMVENRGLTAMPWSIPQPFALIGRDPAADLSLDHPRVDRYHAYLQVIDGGVYWVDLGSQTGTRLEDGTARSGWLDYPRGIGIGPYVIQLAREERDAPDSIPRQAIRPDPFSSRLQDSDDLPCIVLEFRRDSYKPIRWRMRHLLTLVGSSSHCKVRLSAPGVSPFHCSLLRTDAGVWVVNLAGPGGVTVNGSSIRASRLEDGDELRVGEIGIRVLFQESGATNGRIKSPAVDGPGRTTLLAHPAVISRELATSHPNAGWMAPDREAGRLLADQVSGEGEGELSASMLALVLDQFGQMQQQFLDQFQQTSLMMFRALGTMHRDQMEELREKLDSIHQLSEKIQAFQAQRSASVAPGNGRLPHEGVYPTSPPPEFVSTIGRDKDGDGPGRSAVASMGRETLSPEEDGAEELRARLRSIVDQPNIPSMNVHEWLIGRIAALEDEQRTRWQKILDLVRGK
jgi:pSer/pThr/pTyr-binding forkhead associated (FHA) protein